MKNPSYPHSLQAAIQDRLLQRDAAGAWAAVEALAKAVRRSKVSLHHAPTRRCARRFWPRWWSATGPSSRQSPVEGSMALAASMA